VKEVQLRESGYELRLATFEARLARILEMQLQGLPVLASDEDPANSWITSRWLGGVGLGLVPVAEPASFAWAGPWLARLKPPAGPERFAVMYGVPSGVVWDPGGDGTVDADWIADTGCPDQPDSF
jgi:hypothetical protein